MISKLAENIIDVAYKVKNADGTWTNVPKGMNAEQLSRNIAMDAKDTAPHFLLGALRGFTRSLDLTDDERKDLARHYGIENDWSIPFRNAGRGIAGSAAGWLPGYLVFKAINREKHPNLKVLSALATAVSGFTGAEVMTEKYSPKRAREIAAGNI